MAIYVYDMSWYVKSYHITSYVYSISIYLSIYLSETNNNGFMDLP